MHHDLNIDSLVHKKLQGNTWIQYTISIKNKINHKVAQKVFLSRNYRLIVAARKFDVLKTNQCLPKKRSLEDTYATFKNIKFPRGNYRTDSSETVPLKKFKKEKREKLVRISVVWFLLRYIASSKINNKPLTYTKYDFSIIVENWIGRTVHGPRRYYSLI